MAKANAPIIVILVVPLNIPAKTTPTAIPSGILWRVTARININDLFKWEGFPSGLSLLTCKCGMIVSRINKKPIPNKNPIAAGSHWIFKLEDISIAGIKSDQTDAAIITPEAKPNKAFCILGFMSFFKKKTNADPNVVPIKGINIPIVAFKKSLITSSPAIDYHFVKLVATNLIT